MKKEKIITIIKILKKKYPSTFFNRNSNEKEDSFYALISTVLSQRTRDEVTYPVAARLFKVLKTPKDFAGADTKKIARLIIGVGFYKTKAMRIKQISKILLEKYNGKVPDSEEKLLQLPGVGRKTANCVLVYGFRKNAIPVDTHVHRISNRLGVVKTKTPEQTETELVKIIPKQHWIALNELFVKHGQTVCRPINPRCEICSIKKYCGCYQMINKFK